MLDEYTHFVFESDNIAELFRVKEYIECNSKEADINSLEKTETILKSKLNLTNEDLQEILDATTYDERKHIANMYGIVIKDFEDKIAVDIKTGEQHPYKLGKFE